MHIVIIPARGGSKRIPKKNIKNFYGKPIIAWSILTAIKSKLFDKIIVSTDNKKIAELSKHYGAEIPFIRDKSLSDDVTGLDSVIQNALKILLKKGWIIDSVCCILPTSPFTKIDDLIAAKKIIQRDNIDYVFAATNFNYTIYRSFIIKKNKIKINYPKKLHRRSQDFEEVYHDAGQFYWGCAKSWLKKKSIFGNNSKIIKIPNWRTQDINIPDDWHRAELIYKIINKKK